LLNIGPTPEGAFPLEAEKRRCQIGEWMATHSQAIHDTTYGPPQDIPFALTTARPGIVYLHLLDWPANGRIAVQGLEAVNAIILLETGQQLAYSQSGGKLVIELPRKAPDPVVSILQIRTK
jgi:alpha-L-fucosidase